MLFDDGNQDRKLLVVELTQAAAAACADDTQERWHDLRQKRHALEALRLEHIHDSLDHRMVVYRQCRIA